MIARFRILKTHFIEAICTRTMKLKYINGKNYNNDQWKI